MTRLIPSHSEPDPMTEVDELARFEADLLLNVGDDDVTASRKHDLVHAAVCLAPRRMLKLELGRDHAKALRDQLAAARMAPHEAQILVSLDVPTQFVLDAEVAAQLVDALDRELAVEFPHRMQRLPEPNARRCK